MNSEILSLEEMRIVKGGEDGSDLSNTVQTPSDEPDTFKASSDLSNTVQ